MGVVLRVKEKMNGRIKNKLRKIFRLAWRGSKVVFVFLVIFSLTLSPLSPLFTWTKPLLVDQAEALTFSASMGKRTAPGPFAAAPILQENWPNGGEGDDLYFSNGSLISNPFRTTFDGGQGSIVFWITPEWDGDDNLEHPIIYADFGRLDINKTTSNTLSFKVHETGATATTKDISDWVAGNTYGSSPVN